MTKKTRSIHKSHSKNNYPPTHLCCRDRVLSFTTQTQAWCPRPLGMLILHLSAHSVATAATRATRECGRAQRSSRGQSGEAEWECACMAVCIYVCVYSSPEESEVCKIMPNLITLFKIKESRGLHEYSKVGI